MVLRKQLKRTEVFQALDKWTSFNFSKVDLILTLIRRFLTGAMRLKVQTE
jgi:hypothetical protein